MTGRASRRALVAIVTALGLALAIIIIAAVLDTLPGAGTTASTPPIPGSVQAPTGLGGGAENSTDGPVDADGDAPGTEGPEPGQKPLEVLPPSEEKSPIGLPPSPPLPDLITRPLPPTASESGALVAGYPASVIPPSPDSTVTSSSVASAENRLQVTLAASTPMTADAVLAFYRVTFAANDLVDSPAPAAAGSTALLFSRGTDTILLTVTPTKSGESTYSVFGAFTAAK